MTRSVKVKKTIAVIEPVVERPTQEYVDYTTALIRYGLLMFRKINGELKQIAGNKTEDIIDLYDEPIDLSSQQAGYLNMRMSGLSVKKSCQLLGLDLAHPLLWEEELGLKSVYGYCIEAIKRTQAINLEDVVWDKALNDDSKGLMAMFALKSRMSEYKDNYVSNGSSVVVVNLQVDGKPYVVADITETAQPEDSEYNG